MNAKQVLTEIMLLIDEDIKSPEKVVSTLDMSKAKIILDQYENTIG